YYYQVEIIQQIFINLDLHPAQLYLSDSMLSYYQAQELLFLDFNEYFKLLYQQSIAIYCFIKKGGKFCPPFIINLISLMQVLINLQCRLRLVLNTGKFILRINHLPSYNQNLK